MRRSGSGVTNPRARGVAASCILRCGALDAAMCFACLSHPCGCSEARAFILFAPCDAPKIARQLCIVPKGRPRSVLVFRRSRRARLPGDCARARLATFACTPASGSGPSSASRFRERRPSSLSLRVHDQELLIVPTSLVPAVLASRRPRATLHRLTAHGLANSCHVSTSAGDDPLPFEDHARTSHPAIAPALALRRWRLPSRRPCDPCPALRRFMSRSRRTMTLSGHRRACVHLSFWTDFRSQPKHPRPIHTLRCVPTASSPAPRSTCISRRSRSAALPCSRSRNVFVGCRVALPTPCPPCDVHVPGRSPRSTPTHMFSHTSISAAAFRLQRRGCRDLPAPASSRLSGTFRHQPSRDVEHLLKLQHLSASDLSRCSLNTLTARVHIQRIVIEKVGSFVSDRTALLKLSRLPTRPPGLRSPRLSSLPPPSRKISLVRLAALPFR
jgi:hypothetical protein